MKCLEHKDTPLDEVFAMVAKHVPQSRHRARHFTASNQVILTRTQ